MKLLIKNIDEIYTVDKDEIIKNGYIIINGNSFYEIGSMKDIVVEDNEFDYVIDAKGKVALPGLINCHTHAGMTLLRGYADDLPLKKWLEEKIWPFEATLSDEEIYWGTMLAIMEMIETGTTTFVDMYFSMERVAEAVITSGIRAVLTPGLIEANDGEDGLYRVRDFCLAYQGEADGRITTMLAPHAPYTCSTSYLQKIASVSKEENIPVHIHVAETEKEYHNNLQEHGVSPVQYLKKIGLLDCQVLAAHCVYLNDKDIQVLAKNATGVAYNPASNMKLASGVAPVTEMLKEDIKVGLGTDSVASNNNLDLLEEARLGSYLQKVNKKDATVLDAMTMLKMLTKNGAKALGLDKLGKIKQGFLADLILIDITSNNVYYPHHNNLSNILYAGSGRDVDTVIINGEIIMENGELKTMDKKRIFHEIEKIISNKSVNLGSS